MSSEDKGRPLPKFGEWDVNNPASAEGFTLLFNKARNEKMMMNNPAAKPPSTSYSSKSKSKSKYNTSSYKKKWFCCGYIQIVRTAK